MIGLREGDIQGVTTDLGVWLLGGWVYVAEGEGLWPFSIRNEIAPPRKPVFLVRRGDSKRKGITCLHRYACPMPSLPAGKNEARRKQQGRKLVLGHFPPLYQSVIVCKQTTQGEETLYAHFVTLQRSKGMDGKVKGKGGGK